MILRLPSAVANPTSIASTTNATPPTVLFAPHHCRKTAAVKANKIRNLFYFIEFLFCRRLLLRNTASATPIARWAIRLRNWRLLLRNTALGLRLLPDGQYGYAIGAYCCAIRRSGYAYCPMGNTATQLAPIAAQYGARIAITML